MSQGVPLKSISTELELFKNMMDNVVVKRYQYANSLETKESLQAYLRYKEALLQRDSTANYEYYEYDLDRFFYLTPSQREAIIKGEADPKYFLKEKDVEMLLDWKRKNRIDSYVELNDYYREILGLPPYNMSESEYIYVTDVKDVDPNIPLHELPIEQFQLFKMSTRYEAYLKKYPTHTYIKYMYKSVDLVQARDAGPFEVISFDNDSMTIRYLEFYAKEKATFMKTYFNAFRYEHYDQYESIKIMHLKLSAMMNFRLNYALNFMESNSYTEQEATNIWLEYNLTIPPNMPSIYRDTVTFLLNLLHIYKGTDYVIEFIANEIFGNMEVHKYFLCKRLKKGVNFPPVGSKPEDYFDIIYIKAPFHANSPSDAPENTEIIPYNDLAEKDPKWFEDDEEVRRQVLYGDYSYLTSKYLAVNNYLDISELNYRISILDRLIMRHKNLTDTYKIYYKETKTEEKLFDLFIYINALCGYTFGFIPKIPDYMDSVLMMIGFKTPENLKVLRDWFVAYFMRTKYKDLLEDFPTIDDDDTFIEFLEKCNKSLNIADVLMEMLEIADNWRSYQMIVDLYKAIILVEKTPEIFNLGEDDDKTYTAYLKNNSNVLYKRLINLVSLNDHNTLVIELDFLLTTIKEEFAKMVGENSLVVEAVGGLQVILSSIVEYLARIIAIFKDHSTEMTNINMVYKIEGYGQYSRAIDNIIIHLKDIKFKDYSYTQPYDKVYEPNAIYNARKYDRCITHDHIYNKKTGDIIS